MTRQFVLAVEAYYRLFTFFSFFVLCLILFFSCLVAVIFFFLLLFLVYFLHVVCECVPSVIFPVKRTTSGVGDRPSRHNVRTTTTTTYILGKSEFSDSKPVRREQQRKQNQ